MKKIPTLFKRTFEDHNIINIEPVVTEGMEWVLEGKGDATEKIDGSCCAVIDGVFYKRYDAKNGKKPPANAIPCDRPDPITGHHPHWVPVDKNDPADRWFIEAYKRFTKGVYPVVVQEKEELEHLPNWTYEAIGKHFQGNPYNVDYDIIEPHGSRIIEVERTFDGIREYLRDHYIEGIVFWLNGEPKCKIKRSDFGFEWGKK